jgi:hypothetical protein
MARQKKPADAVQFTRESAERVARVVRQAEITPAAASPLTFDRRLSDRHPKQVRAATFSGAWPIGSVKTVTFKYAPTATANVTNLSWPIALSGYVNEDCVVGKEGTSWWLVVPKLEGLTAVFVTQTQQRMFCSGTGSQAIVTDVTISATLNTNNCAISIGKTLSTSSITVVSATATAPFIVSSYTSHFLRLRVP